MAIIDRSKIRADVREFLDTLNVDMGKQTKKYFLKKFYLIPKIHALVKKIERNNDRVFRERIVNYKVLQHLLTPKEILLLAKVMRETTEIFFNWYQKTHPYSNNLTFHPVQIGHILAEWQTPRKAAQDKVLLYFHGGGHCVDSLNKLRAYSAELGLRLGLRVLSINYRLAPENPFPAGLDDCFNVYQWLLNQGIAPKGILIAGESAGGTLTLALLTKLKQLGMEMPAGGICLSPGTNFALDDPIMFKNTETDPILGSDLSFSFPLSYLGDHDPKDPLVSPFWGDLRGFPPLLIQTSQSEMLYFDNQKFAEKAKAAGVPITFHAWEGMIHCFPCYLRLQPRWPELSEAITELETFVQSIFPSNVHSQV